MIKNIIYTNIYVQLNILLRMFGCTFFLFLFSYTIICAQSPSTNIVKGDSLFSTKEYEAALKQFSEIDHNKYAEYTLEKYLKTGNTFAKLKQYENALIEYQKGISAVEDLEHIDSITLGYIYHKKAVALYYEQRKKEAITPFKKALNIRNKVLEKNDMDIAATLFGMGNCYEGIKNFDKAIEYHLQALRIRKANNNQKYILRSYRRLAKSHTWKGDYTQAEEYLLLVIKGQTELYGEKDYSNSVTYNDLGILYRKQKRWDKAIATYQKAIDIKREYDDTEDVISSILSNIGNVYSDQKEFGKAHKKYQEALNLNKKTYGINSDEYLQILSNYGVLQYDQELYDDALNIFLKVNRIVDKLYDSNSPEKVEILLNLADTWREKKDHEKSINTYIEGVNILTKRNDQIISLETETYIDVQEKELLLLFIKGYIATIERKTPESALDYYVLFAEITDQMRQSQTAEESKIFWTGELLPVFEKGIQLCHELYQRNKDDKYINSAFIFFEKSKNITLLESINEQDALQQSAIPISIINELDELDFKIADLETEKFYAEKEDIEISKNIIELRQKKQAIISKLEKEHPEYYQLKYETQIETALSTAKKIEKDESVVSFFLGDSSLYTIVIEKDQMDFKKTSIQRNEITKKIQRFLEGMYEYHFSKERSKELYVSSSEKYTQEAYGLYELLFKSISIQNKNLIIIPDHVLGYLPFEALLTHEAEKASLFRKHQYFVKEKNISYAYSSTMHFQMQEKNIHPEKRKILAYAPQFQGQESTEATEMQLSELIRNGLSELVYNVEEVESIQKIFNTDIIQGKKASKQHFSEHSEKYSVLHFATHGKTNDEHSAYSFLAFSPDAKDSTEQHLLYVKDLYQMQLQADMVVLSACETGVGKLKKGEGIISLSRGFSYAGAKSLVTTLWSVNDVQTSKLVSLFYQQLGQGEQKNQALSQAKRDFIQNSTPQYAHPYYWAAPILIGDIQTLEISAGIPWLWIGLGILSLFVLVWVWRRFLSKSA